MFKRALVCLLLVVVHCAGSAHADQTIVVIGDSLSSGYGLGTEKSWVALLEERLDEQAYEYTVINASIAGDTSAGGLARLPRLLDTYAPTIVVIELGGNDGLRGLPIASLRENLARMIESIEETGAKALLAGIQIPPNYGIAYTDQFTQVYFELAERYGVALVEFLMDGVALDPAMMQGDRIHPNADGQGPMMDNVWNVLNGLL